MLYELWIKTRAGGLGSVAAGVGGLVKSVLQKRPRETAEAEGPAPGKDVSDGAEQPFGQG